MEQNNTENPFKTLLQEGSGVSVETNAAEPEASIEDQAANMMKFYWKPFCKGIDMLSNKALVRIIKALVGYPWEVNTLKFKDNTELDTYIVAEQIRNANQIMRQISLKEKQKENEENVTTTEEV